MTQKGVKIAKLAIYWEKYQFEVWKLLEIWEHTCRNTLENIWSTPYFQNIYIKAQIRPKYIPKSSLSRPHLEKNENIFFSIEMIFLAQLKEKIKQKN